MHLIKGKEGHVLVERPEVMEQSQEEGVIGGEVKGGEGGGVKGLLSLWREKVFALLVQGRLQQIQHSRDTEEAQCRVSEYSNPLAIAHVSKHILCSIFIIIFQVYSLNDSQISGLQGEVSEATRGRDLVSHTLTDRTAQLQLQINRTEVHVHVHVQCVRSNVMCIYIYMTIQHVCRKRRTYCRASQHTHGNLQDKKHHNTNKPSQHHIDTAQARVHIHVRRQTIVRACIMK